MISEIMSKEGRNIFSGKTLKRGVLVLVVLALAGLAALYFKKYQDLKNNPLPADQAAQAQVERTIQEVGKLYALPKDEKPSVATVSDKEKLKDQPFFANAENGDVTLIYSNAKLAILYRPTTNQIINVSSVTIQSSTRVKVIGPEAARQSVERALTSAQIVYIDGGNAKGTYNTIIVVDLTGQNSQQANTIATAISGKVGELPSGEPKPSDTDILVIAGSSQPAP